MYDTGTDGGNADGFAVGGETSLPGPGMEFTGCRAWNNSDDGFDVWKAAHTVKITNCYSFKNGNHSGDGNGFKLGINKTDEDRHILKNCIAWKNRENGFDYNDNTLPQTLYNCTAYNNKRNYKFGNIGGGPEIHNLQNCISAITEADDYLLPSIIDSNINSWNYIPPNANDIIMDNFISTDDNIISGKRNSDGSIPESDFLRLKERSLFIDAGIDVGLPFNGDAPDLGAFESEYALNIKKTDIGTKEIIKLSSYPNPTNGNTVVSYNLPPANNRGKLTVYNILGKKVKSFILNNNCGSFTISTGDLPSGIYIYVIKTVTNISSVKKIIVVK